VVHALTPIAADAALEHVATATALRQRSDTQSNLLVAQWQQLEISSTSATLCAVGGFGRQALFPRSDIDILIITTDDLDADTVQKIERFQAALWQQKLDLACSVRSVQQASQFAETDVSFMTSLLDLRYLAGDQSLVQQLVEATASEVMWRPSDFFVAKLQEQHQRHQKFSDTAFNNEPNIKEGPGGLRDLHTLYWIAKRAWQFESFADWANADFISQAEHQALSHAQSLLEQLRFALHQTAKRKEERLLFDYQIQLAAQFGFVDRAVHDRAVEQLMQGYFRAAGDVQRISEMVVARFAQRLAEQSGSHQVQKKALTTGYLDADGLLEQSQIDSREFHGQTFDTLAALQALGILQTHPQLTGLAPGLARKISDLAPSDATADPSYFADAYLAILDAPQRVAQTIALAAKLKLLGKIWPAFERVTGRMQYDLFHAYTVDQHTLFVLRQLEALRAIETNTEFPIAVEVWKRVRKPRLLFLAALFHDIAKGRGGDHSELGKVDAEQYLTSLGLPEPDVALVAWLVEQHLTMSTIAQKRDIQDPEVVKQFALLVADRERLDHLFLLTVADIRGTNPKLWNSWKARLLEDLYSATRSALRRGLENPVHASERIAMTQREALELLQSHGAIADQVRAVWEDFPNSAFLRHSADEISFQTQAVLSAARKHQAHSIAMRAIAGTGAYELFVRVADREGLFATLTAVLDRASMSVLGARIASTSGGYTHDTFQLQDLQPTSTSSARQRLIEVQMELQVALTAPQLVPKISQRLATREQKHFQFPAQIEVETHDAALSKLSLTCADSYGLLAKVAMTFFEQQLRVSSARIATFGERVEDIFLISNEYDQALSPTQSAALIAALAKSLESPQAAHSALRQETPQAATSTVGQSTQTI
jgi:[protein-PII] uridylyltransferase